jgi:hypothetical protein
MMDFATKEDAVAFAKKNGMYVVEKWESCVTTVRYWVSTGPRHQLPRTTHIFLCAVLFPVAGFEVDIREPHQKKMQRKSYGENFHWSKRTRVGQK